MSGTLALNIGRHEDYILPDLATKRDILELKLWMVGVATAVVGVANSILFFALRH